MLITHRGFVLVAGLMVAVAEPRFEFYCALTEPPLATRSPIWCLGNDCQQIAENFPWHTDSESDSETPSTVLSISASGGNSNVAAGVYSTSYNFDVSRWSGSISPPPVNPTEAHQQLPATQQISSIPKAKSSRRFGNAQAGSRPFYSGIARATWSQSSRIEIAQRMGTSSRFGQRGFALHLPRSA
jgi:hypothetical protein